MSTPDADEQLRQTVSRLAGREDCAWAGIYFVEVRAGRASSTRRAVFLQ